MSGIYHIDSLISINFKTGGVCCFYCPSKQFHDF